MLQKKTSNSGFPSTRAAICLAAVALALAGCVSHPVAPGLPQTALARTPEINVGAGTGERSLEISVMTYNIAGLPWPVRAGRGRALARIGAHLGALRAQGLEPDVVLIQEGFIGKMGDLIERSGYPNFARGPLAGDRAPKFKPSLAADYKRKKYRRKGEGLGKWTSGGLYVLSNFPILEVQTRPFRYCAGFDCLANKGVQLVRLEIPGMPVPLEVLNTHLNARRSSAVPVARTLMAHHLQVEELIEFLREVRNPEQPLIFGGDFNTRHNEERIKFGLERAKGLNLMESSYYCTRVVHDCDIRVSFDGDEPWLDTRDYIGFSNGQAVNLRPVIIEAMFDSDANGGVLSDHDGYLVHFRLTWPDPERIHAGNSVDLGSQGTSAGDE